MKYEIGALGIGGVLDQAINLLRDHFRLFAKIVLVLYLPAGIVVSLMAAAWLRSREGLPETDLGSMSLFWSYMIVALVVGFVVYPLCNSAIIYAASKCYLDQPVTVGDAYRLAARVFFPVLGTMTLVGFVCALGFAMCVVPSILFFLWFFLSVQITVLEGLTGTAALGRSRQLMRPNLGKAFLLLILVIVIGACIGQVTKFVPQLELQLILKTVLDSGLFVFGAAVWVVFYFSCRARAEHFDLAMLADAVATSEEGTEPGGSSRLDSGEF